ncbi:hypothetical protein [Aeromonas sp. 600886]|uniref:hypothetical protein n=1 Tax=Aeromonas TaxID=642 RepID=UPI003BA24306
MFIESVASRIVATSIFEFARSVFVSKSDDPIADDLYKCFDKAAEKYCKSIERNVEGGFENLFIWHVENWQKIYDLLSFKVYDLQPSDFIKTSICGNYHATDDMVRAFIEHVKVEISKNGRVAREINAIKVSMDSNHKINEVLIKLSVLQDSLESKKETRRLPNVKHSLKINKEDLEVKISSILSSQESLSWIENSFYKQSKKLLLELAVNAFYHGNASECAVKIDGKKFILEDDGEQFNTKSEFLNRVDFGGGAAYFKSFLDEYASYVTVNYEYEGGKNKLSLIFNNYDQILRDHCLISVDNSTPPPPKGVVFLEECNRYFVDAGNYQLTSKAFRVIDYVLPQLPEGKQLVVFTSDPIERKVLKQRFISDRRVIVEG